MKKIIFLTLLTNFSLVFYTSGQQTITDLISNSVEASEEIEFIYDLDVFQYFKLTEYDTELKKSIYKKTNEYQTKLTELKNLKTKMLNTTYYTTLFYKFSSSNNYDVKRKGFEIELGSNMGIGTIGARTPKTINNFLFKSLPTKEVSNPLFPLNVKFEYLFIQIDELSGLEIENDRDKIVIYFFFIPNGKEKTTYKYFNSTQNAYSGWCNITETNIKSEKVRVVVANMKNGKIYYDKNYSTPNSLKK